MASEINGYDIKAVQQAQNASILASALFRLGLVCWSVCFLGECVSLSFLFSLSNCYPPLRARALSR